MTSRRHHNYGGIEAEAVRGSRNSTRSKATQSPYAQSNVMPFRGDADHTEDELRRSRRSAVGSSSALGTAPGSSLNGKRSFITSLDFGSPAEPSVDGNSTRSKATQSPYAQSNVMPLNGGADHADNESRRSRRSAVGSSSALGTASSSSLDGKHKFITSLDFGSPGEPSFVGTRASESSTSNRAPAGLSFSSHPPPAKRARLTDDNRQDIPQHRNASGSYRTTRSAKGGSGSCSTSAINIDDSDHESQPNPDSSTSGSRNPRPTTSSATPSPTRPFHAPSSPDTTSASAFTSKPRLAVASDEDDRSKNHQSIPKPSRSILPNRIPSSPSDDSRDPIDFLADPSSRLSASPTTGSTASRMAGKIPSDRQLGKSVPGSLREAQMSLASTSEATQEKIPASKKDMSFQLEQLLIGSHVVDSAQNPLLEFTASGRYISIKWRANGPKVMHIDTNDVCLARVQSIDRGLEDKLLLQLELAVHSDLARRLQSEYPGYYDPRSSQSSTVSVTATSDDRTRTTWASFCKWLKSALRTDIEHINGAAAKALYDSSVRPLIKQSANRKQTTKEYLASKEKSYLGSSERPKPRPLPVARSSMDSAFSDRSITDQPKRKVSLFEPRDPGLRSRRSGPLQMESAIDRNGDRSGSSSMPAPSRPKPKPLSGKDSAAMVPCDSESFYNKSATRRSVANGTAKLFSEPLGKKKTPELRDSSSPPLRRPARTHDSLLLKYPFEARGTVDLFESDCDRLQEGEFLNDTVIEFGLKYHLEQIRIRDEHLFNSLYVFNTFFYRQLTKSKNKPNEMYQHVRKWTAKTDIFAKKFLVIPINEHLHWYLAIVLNPGKALDYVVDEDANTFNDDQSKESSVERREVQAQSRQESEMQTPTPPPDRKTGNESSTDEMDAELQIPPREPPQQDNESDPQRIAGHSQSLESPQGNTLDPTAGHRARTSTFQHHQRRHLAAGSGSTSPSRPSSSGSDRGASEIIAARGGDGLPISAELSRSVSQNLILDTSGHVTESQRRAVNDDDDEGEDDDDDERSFETGTRPSDATSRTELAIETDVPSPASSISIEHDELTTSRNGRTGSDGSASSSDIELMYEVSNINNRGRGTLQGGGPPTGSQESPKRQAMVITPGESIRRKLENSPPRSLEQDRALAGSAGRPRAKPTQSTYGSRWGATEGRSYAALGTARVSGNSSAARRPSGRRSTPVDVSPGPDGSRPSRQSLVGNALNLPLSPSPPPEQELPAASVSKVVKTDSKPPSPARPNEPTDRRSQTIINNREALQGLCVITFDSLGGSHSAVKTQVTHYLRNEAKDKKNLSIDPKVRYLNVAVPEQKNFCDCGLFVLLYFERFFRDVEAFVERIIPEKDSKNESWQAESAKTARQHWRALIADLAEQYREKRKADEEAAARAKAAAAAAGNGGGGGENAENGGSKENETKSGEDETVRSEHQPRRSIGGESQSDVDDFEMVTSL